MSWLEKDTGWMQRAGGRNPTYFHHHRASHQSSIFLQDPKHACCLVWDMKDLMSAFMCVSPVNSPNCEHSWALVPSKADQRQQHFQHHIHAFAHVCTQTCARIHMEIFPPKRKKKKSFQVKRSLWGYQQCRLIDIFSVSLLMPSGIDKAERNNNFPAWLPISRADGQWQNIWSSVRAPLKN